MIDQNEARVLSMIRPGDMVLDVGGWARPFNRANYVLDRASYETRGQHYARHHNLLPQGGEVEHFTAETWIRRDICDHAPWPFEDKSIDFCMCSNTLEDIRDPLWVCHEMIRVAKRGYIEVPSRLFETCRGREAHVPVGLNHHWWLIEIEGSHITFYPKYHLLHGDYRLSLPTSFYNRLPYASLFSWLFWDDSFTYSEGDPHFEGDFEDARQVLQSFVDRYYQYPPEEAVALDRIQAEYQARLEAPLDHRADRPGPAPGPHLRGDDLGPTAIALARRVRSLSLRYPRLARALKRLARING
jgi:hypothetical protein